MINGKIMYKLCLGCRKNRPIQKFLSENNTAYKTCIICRTRHKILKKQRDPIKHNEDTKRLYHKKPLETHIARNLKRRYNITIDDYNKIFKEQNGVCKICLQPETVKDEFGRLKKLVVDHCHIDGHIRGLLCHKHNLALGLINDSTTILYNAIKYLKDDDEKLANKWD